MPFLALSVCFLELRFFSIWKCKNLERRRERIVNKGVEKRGGGANEIDPPPPGKRKKREQEKRRGVFPRPLFSLVLFVFARSRTKSSFRTLFFLSLSHFFPSLFEVPFPLPCRSSLERQCSRCSRGSPCSELRRARRCVSTCAAKHCRRFPRLFQRRMRMPLSTLAC